MKRIFRIIILTLLFAFAIGLGYGWAALHPRKRTARFIVRLNRIITRAEAVNSQLQTVKAKWIADAPGLNGLLTEQQATAANNMITQMNTFITSNHAATIAMLKSKNVYIPESGMEGY